MTQVKTWVLLRTPALESCLAAWYPAEVYSRLKFCFLPFLAVSWHWLPLVSVFAVPFSPAAGQGLLYLLLSVTHTHTVTHTGKHWTELFNKILIQDNNTNFVSITIVCFCCCSTMKLELLDWQNVENHLPTAHWQNNCTSAFGQAQV